MTLLRSPSKEPSAANGHPESAQIFAGTWRYGLGHVAPRALNLFLLPIYARFFTAADYGFLELATVVTTALSVLARFGLPAAALRAACSDGDRSELRRNNHAPWRAAFWGSALLALALIAIAVLLAALIYHTPWAGYLPGSKAQDAAASSWAAMPPSMGLWMAINIFCQPILVLHLTWLQAHQRAGKAAKIQTMRTLSAAACTWILVITFNLGATGAVAALAAASLLALGHALWDLRFALLPHPIWHPLKRLMPLALGSLLTDLSAVVPPLLAMALLVGIADPHTAGLLGLARRILVPLAILTTAFSTAYLPVYYRHRSQALQHQKTSPLHAAPLGFGLALLGTTTLALIAGPICVETLLPARLHLAAPLVVVVGIERFLTGMHALYGSELLYRAQSWRLASSATLALLTTLMAMSFATPAYGALGAACASLLGTAVLVGMRLVWLRPTFAPHTHRHLGQGATICLASYLVWWGWASILPHLFGQMALALVLCIALPLALGMLYRACRDDAGDTALLSAPAS